MATRKTRAEAEMDELLQKLDPDSERYHVLKAARDFKAAWVEMGQQLTAVRETGSYRDWGYTSFEAYCRRELRLKADTANKLTRSFAFVRDHEPSALESETRELPSLEVVDLLSRAREKAKVTDEQLAEIRDEVFSPESAVPTKNQVIKRFREVDPDAFRPAPKDTEPKGDVSELRKALLLSERLVSLMEAQPGVSEGSVDGVKRASAELKQLFEAQRESAENEERKTA